MQPQLFPTPASIVNVASVPQRSPFRYPGGKTWLIPRLREWLSSLSISPKLLVEPFAGGGIVSLTTAFEKLADSVLMVELDCEVAAVWQTILSDKNSWLADQILSFDMTHENLRALLCSDLTGIHNLGFKTLVRNRVNHGGILAPGSGTLKNGENGRGIRSRWYPQTLANRIRNIERVRDKIRFECADAFEVIERYKDEHNTVFFIDPPYTAAGKRAGTRLYTHYTLDHDRLFRLAAEVEGDVLMTYDHADGVIDLARKYGLQYEAIPMKSTHHAEMSELLIGKDLSWVRRLTTFIDYDSAPLI
ncbi:DNA adenine methylase [soil metagenome]